MRTTNPGIYSGVVDGMADWNDEKTRAKAAREAHKNIALPKPVFGIGSYGLTSSMKSILAPYMKEDNNKVDKVLDDTINDNIKRITVYGHSLGMVDYYVFKKIFEKCTNKVTWEIYYKGENDLYSKDQAFKKMLREYLNEDNNEQYYKLLNEERIIYKNADIYLG